MSPARAPIRLISTTLPPDAVRDLIAAATTENTATNPHRRQKAIERATLRAQKNHPDYFRKEQ